MKVEDAKYSGYIVYRYTNMENGKQYVGITKQGSIGRRAKKGTEYGKCPHLDNAIKKYGWDSFAKEVLHYGLTKDEAEYLEKHYIAKWNLTDNRFGYNIQQGGVGGCGKSVEGIQSLHDHNVGLNANKQRPICVFDAEGNKVGEFALITFAAQHYGIKRGTLINHLCKGKYLCNGLIFKYKDDVGNRTKLDESELKKYLVKKSIAGVNHYRATGVVIFDVITGERISEFPTIAEAKRCFSGDVQGCLLKKQLSFGGRYTARYSNDVSSVDRLSVEERFNPSETRPKRQKRIAQYSLDERFLLEYPSALDASQKTGIGYSAICLCASGKTKTSGGYKWKYLE